MELISSEPSVLLDGAVIVVFLIFAFLKGDKGLYKTIVPVLVTVTAVSAAIILSEMLKNRVADAVFPWAWDQLRSRIDLSAIRTSVTADVASQLEKLLPDTVMNIAGSLGLTVKQAVSSAAESAVAQADARALAEQAARAVLYPVTVAVVRVGLFFLFFVLLKVMLGLLTAAAGLAFDLPVIGWLDRAGGALVGVVECAVVLLILVRLIQISGVAPLIAVVQRSRILSLFLKSA